MQEKTIQVESVPLKFIIEDDACKLNLAKSYTRVKDTRQLTLMTESANGFVPMKIEEEADQFVFTFFVDHHLKTWQEVKKLGRNDQLRLLCNLARFQELLSTRITFFLQPDNIVFDDNLLPAIVYRGIRELVPPLEMDEALFFKQYQCLCIALLSDQYSYDELYHGALANARATAFERGVSSAKNLAELIAFLQQSYRAEQTKTEQTMQLVPRRRFRLFKQLTFVFIILSFLLAVPLAYIAFVKSPNDERLLTAHRYYLAGDYGGVISTLQNLEPESLPTAAKYILAYAYVRVETLSDQEKKVIMNNISLRSDPNYLLYWIYNGKGDFEKSIDLAKYIDDPQLIMYGLIKKIEQDKNNPNLSGSEREELVTRSQEELDKYRSAYGLDDNEAANTNIEDEIADLEEQEAENGANNQETDESNEANSQDSADPLVTNNDDNDLDQDEPNSEAEDNANDDEANGE